MRPLYRPRDGVCSRGWLFLGEQGGPCDQACEFCYYAFQKNLVFYSFETVIGHANLFRHYYKLDACDITGGEATIYKTKTGDIVDLVRHCAAIGLRPTIITHGQNNRDDWKLGRSRPQWLELEEAGLDDWLVSLHGGSAASHDKSLSKDGSFERLLAGLGVVKRPVRFNTTLTLTNYRDLPTKILLDRPPTVWNCIMFNPFHSWAGEKWQEIDFQVEYREAAPYLARAIEDLEAVGWEVNVRYWPMCIAEEFGFARNVCGYHQVPFDPWEWRLNVTARNSVQQIDGEGGWYDSERKRALEWMARRDNEVCRSCSYSSVCDKPPEQYQAKFGIGYLSPVSGKPRIEDPLHFQYEGTSAGHRSEPAAAG